MVKKIFVCCIAAVFSICGPSASAQRAGDIAVGLRPTPDGGGVTGRFFLQNNFVIEAQINGGGIFDGTSTTGVGLLEYQMHLPVPDWYLYFGGGIHFGGWDRYDDGYTQGIFGIDGVVGVEYRFRNIPLGLSADFKPAINLASDVAFFPHNIVGVAGRFYFGAPRHAAPPPHHRM